MTRLEQACEEEPEDDDPDADGDHERLASSFRERRRHGNREREEDDADELHFQEIVLTIVQSRRGPGKREYDHQIEKNEGREAGECARDENAEIVFDDREDR